MFFYFFLYLNKRDAAAELPFLNAINQIPIRAAGAVKTVSQSSLENKNKESNYRFPTFITDKHF